MDIMSIVNAMQPQTISRLALNAADFPNNEASIPFMGVFVQLFQGAILPSPSAVVAYQATYEASILTDSIKVALAAHRYDIQTGGVVIDGHPFRTDIDSQFALTGAFMAAQANPAISINWKMADGTFATLNAAAITSAWSQGMGFVQKCFDSEKTVIAAVATYATAELAIAAFDALMVAP